jgi:DNA-binding MarR family transcriptional regulator
MCAYGSVTAGDGTSPRVERMSERKPIGYWLKELDRLIEQTLDRALADEGVTRRDWQVLNVLEPAPGARDEVVDKLRPFWGVNAADPDAVLEGLIARGWALRDADRRYALSAEGETARGALLERVNTLRAAIADGVTPEQYNTTIDTLRRMAENLAALDAAAGEANLGEVDAEQIG